MRISTSRLQKLRDVVWLALPDVKWHLRGFPEQWHPETLAGCRCWWCFDRRILLRRIHQSVRWKCWFDLAGSLRKQLGEGVELGNRHWDWLDSWYTPAILWLVTTNLVLRVDILWVFCLTSCAVEIGSCDRSNQPCSQRGHYYSNSYFAAFWTVPEEN